MEDNYQSVLTRSTKADVPTSTPNSPRYSDVVNSTSQISAAILAPATVSRGDGIHELSGKNTPELQSKRGGVVNSSSGSRPDNKYSSEMVDESNDSKVGINNNQLRRNDHGSEVRIAPKTETKSSGVQPRDLQKGLDDKDDELVNNISEGKNRIIDESKPTQTKMDGLEMSDDNEPSSVVEPNTDSRNSFGDGSEDQKHQSDQQPTQDSDLSPSHSSISTKTNNDHDDANKDQDFLNSSALGRNRRVRQKNSRFADFHCMQLVKGCRSKDDYEVFSPSTSATRSSNRRSTTDSSRGSSSNTNQKSKNPGQTIDPHIANLVTKLCRKCGILTVHDADNQCQCCIYNTIVSATKRKKTQKSQARSKPKEKSKSSSQKQPKQQDQTSPAQLDQQLHESQPLDQSQDEKEKQQQQTHTQTQTHQPQQPQQPTVDDRQEPTKANDSQKRKWVVKPSKSASDDNVISICREIDSSNQDNIGQRGTNGEPVRKVIIKTNDEQVVDEKMIDSGDGKRVVDSMSVTTAKSGNINAGDNNPNTVDDDLDNQNQPVLNSKPDTWTPDQVAQYVSSKGFTNESDLFRQQAVDGLSLLMMKRQDFTYGLKMKLGPALKLYEQVCRLRREFDRETATAS